MCVVPLRTNGRAHFSLDAGPMPASLVGRLSEAEYYGVTERINKALLPLAHFGLSSLLLPFLAIDALTVAVLYGADPSLLVAPLSQDLPDLLLPVLLEITLVAAAFPLVSLLVSRRIGRVQALVREVLDDASRTFAPRGVHFSLKLGVTGAGASTNMWVEMQVAPLFRVPVPVPVPTLYPILLPSANEHAAPAPRRPARRQQTASNRKAGRSRSRRSSPPPPPQLCGARPRTRRRRRGAPRPARSPKRWPRLRRRAASPRSSRSTCECCKRTSCCASTSRRRRRASIGTTPLTKGPIRAKGLYARRARPAPGAARQCPRRTDAAARRTCRLGCRGLAGRSRARERVERTRPYTASACVPPSLADHREHTSRPHEPGLLSGLMRHI
ncbi:hypothetical protein EMIHUDRAFT_443358 [Emiliania huxleyi CCMP1516]|uniref:ABC transmembrane type-1 domain-containing protein n=2 Tax=Emiliania huxleyi TaxID=2903 RepID=A0A0D3JTF1_EMIH1|nr:hypothetical protein EMIHUDRAFT_443358 [Emiliania huxleyi CCMP1516]EOD26786.1 hypothetical protein EMIHUDRAFT_443358 [Emiliania huxleyi CCMP1516]|eukprot:XP_005779215.1 hypothetical protein EMIHUDRAFT_443358 [Emiliania huxleyi CCMP1516]